MASNAQRSLPLGFVASVLVWIPLVLYVVLLGASALGRISAEVTRDETAGQNARLKKDVSRMRAMQSQMAAMARLVQDDAVRTALEVGKYALEEIAGISGLSLEEVKKLQAERG